MANQSKKTLKVEEIAMVKKSSVEYEEQFDTIKIDLSEIKTKLNLNDAAKKTKVQELKVSEKIVNKSDVIVDVDDLSVNYNTPNGVLRAVKDISFKVKKNTITSIVGESGSGKSTTASALIGMLNHDTGNVKINDYIIPATPKLRTKRFQKYLASTMQFVFQDPFTSMNPKSRVETILREPLRKNNPYDNFRQEKKAQLFDRVNRELLNLVEKSSTESKINLRHIVAKLKSERDDLINNIIPQYDIDKYKVKNAVAEIRQVDDSLKTRLATFVDIKRTQQNKIYKEHGVQEAQKMINQHNKEYDKYIRGIKKKARQEIKELKKDLEEQKLNLKKDKQKIKNWQARTKKERKILESEISRILPVLKSNKNKVKMSAYDSYYREIIYGDMEDMKKSKLLAKKVLEFFPNGILDLIEHGKIVRRVNKIAWYDEAAARRITLLINNYLGKYSRTAAKHATTRLIQDKLVKVGLSPEDIVRYPKDFSGGQKQRIAIARAMMTDPQLLIADEPISSLDVSIQAQITNLIKDLKEQNDLTVIFIAHDLRMVEFISDNIIVMSKGQIVEAGTTEEIFTNPTHPYTRSLFSAIPSINTIQTELKVLDYDFEVYQSPDADLKDFYLSPTHKVFSTNEWIDGWKLEAKKFVVYKTVDKKKK